MKLEEIHWALVTGASSGIGMALSRLLCSKGINLIIHGRNETRLHQLAEELSKTVKVKTVIADLADPQQRHLITEAIQAYAPELLINNAGFGLYGEAISLSTQEQTKMLEVDGVALLEFTLEAARKLVEVGKKGVILNVSSASAFVIFPNLAVYSAIKTFVVHLSESLDEETEPYGIRILAACPGMVSTNFRENAGGLFRKSEAKKSMDVDYAAEQIWKQILNEKKVNIFSTFYRLTTFLAKYVLPKKWVAKITGREISNRYLRQTHNQDRQ